MKRFLLSLALTLTLTAAPALAAGPVFVDGESVDARATTRDNTTYVSLRSVTKALRPGAEVAWAGDRATATAADCTLTAQPGSLYLESNGRALYVPQSVLLDAGRTLVPVRVLAAALGAQVSWDPATGNVYVTSGEKAPTSEECYDADALYWLAQIISAESQGEPLTGKIAVGNVVLNRVASADFPDNIYDVIFDSRWGGQFEPVRNGSIYWTPTDESVVAAKLVLEGANTVGKSLYFLAPDLTNNHWTMESRSYIATIGSHWFYQ